MVKASYRDVMQFLHDLFDYPISLGTVAGIVDGAGDRAATVNAAYDLSGIQECTADEVFHRHQPILTAVDIPSRFCALLAKEEHRDADSWGVHLLYGCINTTFNRQTLPMITGRLRVLASIT